MCKITLRNKLTRLLFPCLALMLIIERLCGGEKNCNTKFTQTHTQKKTVLVLSTQTRTFYGSAIRRRKNDKLAKFFFSINQNNNRQ